MDESADQDNNKPEISPDPNTITPSDYSEERSEQAITSQPSSVHPLAQSQQAGDRTSYERGQDLPMQTLGHPPPYIPNYSQQSLNPQRYHEQNYAEQHNYAQQDYHQQGYPPKGMTGSQPAIIGHNTVPQEQVWMPMPQVAQIANCPPGLEYLTQIDQLLVKQLVEIFELLTGYETANKYIVRNSLGQQVYFAAEDSNFCMRNCCGPARSFDMKIIDNTKRVVLNIHRPLRCASCCCFCCLNKMEVSIPSTGDVIGYVEQAWSVIFPKFRVKNATGDTVFRIEGPFCTWSCCGNDVVFHIFSDSTGEEVGKITKQWSGALSEYFTDADNFGISFPMELDPSMKATLLAALFLIDFMFFEIVGNNDNRQFDSPGML